jgi:hypothetical protein
METTLAPKKRSRSACAKADQRKLSSRSRYSTSPLKASRQRKPAGPKRSFGRGRASIERFGSSVSHSRRLKSRTGRAERVALFFLLVTRSEEPALFGCACGFIERLKQLGSR